MEQGEGIRITLRFDMWRIKDRREVVKNGVEFLLNFLMKLDNEDFMRTFRDMWE